MRTLTREGRLIRRRISSNEEDFDDLYLPEMMGLNRRRRASDTSSSEEDSDDSFEIPPNSRKILTSDRIQRFPTFVADQESVDDGCAICIDGVEINKPMIRLDCSHFYCSECITKWLEKSSNCPLCRKEY